MEGDFQFKQTQQQNSSSKLACCSSTVFSLRGASEAGYTVVLEIRGEEKICQLPAAEIIIEKKTLWFSGAAVLVPPGPSTAPHQPSRGSGLLGKHGSRCGAHVFSIDTGLTGSFWCQVLSCLWACSDGGGLERK